MEEMRNRAGETDAASKSTWTLRLAGPQDDSNESLWAGHARSYGYGPAELAGIVSRRRWLASFVFLAVFFPAGAWVWTMRPVYEAAASLIVRGEGTQPAPAGVVAVEVAMVSSRESLRRVVETLGLADGESGVAVAVDDLESKLRIGSAPQSGLITIQYADADPERAADVVNTVANVHLDQRENLRRAAAPPPPEDAGLAAVEQELERTRAELEEFRQRNQGALLRTQHEAARNRSKQLASELRRLDLEVRSAEGVLDDLRREGAEAGIGRAQTNFDRLRNRRAQVVEQLSGAETWRAQLKRLTERHAELEAAFDRAERNYVAYESPVAPVSTADDGLNVSLGHRAEPPPAPVSGNQQPSLLLLSALVASCLALAAAVLADPGRKPVAYVADIADAAGAPVLMMIEETESHVS